MANPTTMPRWIEQGDPTAAEQLLPLVYDELRKLAAQKLAHEKPRARRCPGDRPGSRGLSPFGGTRMIKAHAAGTARRPLLRGRGRSDAPHPDRSGSPQAEPSPRVGGGRQRSSASTEPPPCVAPEGSQSEPAGGGRGARLRLAAEDPVKARLVKLRFFAGLSIRSRTQPGRSRHSLLPPPSAYWILRARLAPRRSCMGRTGQADRSGRDFSTTAEPTSVGRFTALRSVNRLA